VFREGEVDSAAHPAVHIQPHYPEHARLMGRESDVKLAVTVEADGRVSHVEVLSSGGEEFDREAEDALERARFVPARKASEPVAALVSFTVRFRLDE
jgi:TonB family protein